MSMSDEAQHAFLDLAKTRQFQKVIAAIKEDSALVNVQPAGRWSALHQAAEHGDEEVVKFLLSHGANLEAKTRDGKTPEEVAKGSVKHLLKPFPKRKAEDSADSVLAKRQGVAGDSEDKESDTNQDKCEGDSEDCFVPCEPLPICKTSNSIVSDPFPTCIVVRGACSTFSNADGAYFKMNQCSIGNYKPVYRRKPIISRNYVHAYLWWDEQGWMIGAAPWTSKVWWKSPDPDAPHPEAVSAPWFEKRREDSNFMPLLRFPGFLSTVISWK